ncbi:MAG: hypothetical protein IJF07_06440 [Lachnospiraceae bacterium]|nr:hypothetical protein [Lachnospiraceae bacterium]
MAINIQPRNDYTYLFSSLSSSTANATSNTWLSDYMSIKNGSYAKLMKAYYSLDSSDEVKSLAKKNTSVTEESKKELAKVQTTTDALKESADALLVKGSESVFAKKDVTTKNESGAEITTREYDVENIYKAVNSFVNDYNQVINAVGASDNEKLTNRATNMVQSAISNSRLLDKIGITIKENGTISLDKDTFMKADMDTAMTLFNGTGSFGYRVSAQSSMMNFAAEKEAAKSSTYNVSGMVNSTFDAGNLFNTYF